MLEIFFFFSLLLDVLHMISTLCGGCPKYLTASRKQEPATSEVQHKTGMTECWRVKLRAGNRMSFDVLLNPRTQRPPSNSNSRPPKITQSKSGACWKRTEYLYFTRLKTETFPKNRLPFHLEAWGMKSSIPFHLLLLLRSTYRINI